MKRLSYEQDARCLKVNYFKYKVGNFHIINSLALNRDSNIFIHSFMKYIKLKDIILCLHLVLLNNHYKQLRPLLPFRCAKRYQKI